MFHYNYFELVYYICCLKVVKFSGPNGCIEIELNLLGYIIKRFLNNSPLQAPINLFPDLKEFKISLNKFIKLQGDFSFLLIDFKQINSTFAELSDLLPIFNKDPKLECSLTKTSLIYLDSPLKNREAFCNSSNSKQIEVDRISSQGLSEMKMSNFSFFNNKTSGDKIFHSESSEGSCIDNKIVKLDLSLQY